MGTFLNPTTKQKIDTSLFPTVTGQDLANQGFLPSGGTEKKINGGTLFSGTKDTSGKTFERFIQDKPAPITANQQVDNNQQNDKITNGDGFLGGGEKKDTQITQTVDSKVEAPKFLDGLSQEETQMNADTLASEIENLKQQSEQEIAEIRQTGKTRLGNAKGFLAKIGALGRTVSGAPLETNLGVLDYQKNLIDNAIKEERTNLETAISNAKAGSQKAAQERVDALNELIQQNFDNTMKLIQEDRLATAEDRQGMLADLQVDKLNFEIDKANNDLTKENAQDALDQVKEIAKTPAGSLDALAIESLNSLAVTAGLDLNIFPAYFAALQEAERLATAENIAKVDQIEQNILNSIEKAQLDKEALELRKATEARLGAKKSGGGGGTTTTKQDKSTWTQPNANNLYDQYIKGGYSPTDASQRVKELTGYIPKGTNYSAATIPSELKTELVTNITNGADLKALADAYPDVSSSYLNSLYGQYKKKDDTKDEGVMSDEEFLKLLDKKY